MNNYLDLISKDLQNFPQSNSENLDLIQSKKNTFNRFKREFINDINNVKNQKLKLFALLMAIRCNDNEFRKLLMDNFYDFYTLNQTTFAKFVKGIYMAKLFKKSQAAQLLFEVFKINKNYFTSADFLLLIELLQYNNLEKNLQEVFDFLLQTYPNSYIYQKYYIGYLLQICNNKNNENKEELNNLINEKLDYLYTVTNNYLDFNDLGLLYYNAGNKNKFFQCFENVFTSLEYSLSNHKNSNDKNDNFSADDCLESVQELLQILENNGEQAFPEGGTLLGLYRDGKLMDYDKDADIGIIIDEKNSLQHIQKIINIVNSNTNFLHTDSHKNLSQLQLQTSFIDTKRRVIIDIFFYHKKDGFLYSGLTTKLGKFLYKFSAFVLTKTKLNNNEYFIPNNIELYLTELYDKTWQEHISVWDSLINCPNIIPESKMAVFYFCINRFCESLLQHNFLKANNYYQNLQKWNYPFTNAMKNNIESYLAKIKNCFTK